MRVNLEVMLALGLSWLIALPANGEIAKAQFSIFVEPRNPPIIRGTTSLPDGTPLIIVLKKPWLADGRERIARGVSACGEDCLPLEARSTVEQGRFAAGPFSFNGKPVPPGRYPIEIWLPSAKIPAASAVYASVLQISNPPSQVQPTEETRGRTELPTEMSKANLSYESRYFLAGLLLRASSVCSENARRLIDASFDLVSSSELKRVAQAFPEKTKGWMLEGTGAFNTGVMSDGLSLACAHARDTATRAKGNQFQSIR
jgi:hypothetical protein